MYVTQRRTYEITRVQRSKIRSLMRRGAKHKSGQVLGESSKTPSTHTCVISTAHSPLIRRLKILSCESARRMRSLRATLCNRTAPWDPRDDHGPAISTPEAAHPSELARPRGTEPHRARCPPPLAEVDNCAETRARARTATVGVETSRNGGKFAESSMSVRAVEQGQKNWEAINVSSAVVRSAKEAQPYPNNARLQKTATKERSPLKKA